MLSTSYTALKRAVLWGGIFVATIAIVDIHMQRYFMGIVEVCTVLGLITAYILAQRKIGKTWLNHWIVFVAAFVFLGAMLDGGVVGLGFVWSVGFPTVACFLAGARAGLFWSIGYALLALFAVWVSRYTGMFMHYPLVPVYYVLAAYIMFTGFAYFIAASRELKERTLLSTKMDLQNQAEKLAESERNYRTLLETTPNAIGVHCDGYWVYANPAAVHMFGADSVDDILGDTVIDYVAPSHRAMVAERIKHMHLGEKAPLVEEKLVKKNGDTFVAEVQASLILYHGKASILTICRDITEQKKHHQKMAELQHQLEHAQRLESLGVLAGGIAHDFNNILSVIVGNIELIGLEVKEGSRAAGFLAYADEACERAALLCRQMLAYAGKGEFVIESVDIGEYLQGISELLHASVSKKIRLRITADDDLPPVPIDKAQLQQVILNFVINASEAIGDNSGSIQLSVEEVQKDRRTLLRYFNGRSMTRGKYISLRVLDSGSGMDKDTQRRIFDPFFTTKETGNGLGLSAVLGILQRHKGGVRVISEQGKGTEFEVLLPVTRQPVTIRAIHTADTAQMDVEGAVLVVDDEKSLRTMAGALLEKIGFDVLYASNGETGVAMYKAHQDELAAVLLDMTMPKLGGVDAMRMMRDINGAIPIILVSGYSEIMTDDLAEADRPDGFIQKPFRLNTLKKVLFKVIGEF